MLTYKKISGLKICINPRCTGQGQSWPFQIWRLIPDKILIYRIYKENTYSCKNVFWIFLNFRQDVENYILTYYCQKSGHVVTLLTPPLLLGFTAITDHPRVGEVRLWSAVWCGASQHSIQFLVLSCAECAGDGFWVGPALLLFLSGQLGPHRSRQIPETIVLYVLHTWQILAEVSLDLMNVR
jgi:hypothetical protein